MAAKQKVDKYGQGGRGLTTGRNMRTSFMDDFLSLSTLEIGTLRSTYVNIDVSFSVM